MKKRMIASICFIAVLSLAGCTKSTDSGSTAVASVEGVSDSATADTETSDETADGDVLQTKIQLPAVEVGDVISFGSYEQDNDTLTLGATEGVEWMVIARDSGKALILSKHLIDCVPYHNDTSSVSWEESDIRHWLNDSFYESAFSESEKATILETQLETKIPGSSDTAVTTDKVFLLSSADLGQYFEFEYWDETYDLGENGYGLIASSTPYAEEHGAYNIKLTKKTAAETISAHPELEGSLTAMWWLREPGNIVGLSGDTIGNIHWNPGDPLIPISRPYTDDSMGVRPAIWVSVSDK